MKRQAAAVGAVLILLTCTFGHAEAQEVSDETARADVRSVVESYARALASGDSLAALALLHEDVVIYEGGHAETREEYRSGHLRSDIAFASAVKRTVTADDVLLLGGAALYTSEYTAAGRFRDRDIDSHGTETMLLVRTADGWKIRHIHWSSR
ncbi:MAG TPA: nuclear transport factor 2 family protein [Longimicrobiales bacterium]|nr:nuclear transport factor 2 family protein [Longimicrobiales bacterium]